MKALPIPGAFLFDLADQAFEDFVKLQKSLLDLAVEQSTAVVKASKEIVQDTGKAKVEITELIKKSADRTAAAQKSVLEFATNQSKAVSDAVKQQPGVVGTPVEAVANSVQRGVDTVIAVQKDVMEAATKNWKANAAKA
jgi:hypothetical protein